MRIGQRRKVLSALLSLALPAVYSANAYAAKSVDLSKQTISVLQSLVSPAGKVSSGISYSEISRSLGVNGTLHARIQENYQGHPVWGGDAIVHVPNGTRAPASVNALLSSAKSDASMDGILYQDLTVELAKTPAYALTPAQAQAALQHVLSLFYKQSGAHPAVKDESSELMVYVDQKNKAHWIYKVTFFAEPLRQGQLPASPIYLIDALTFKVYENWDNIQTIDRVAVIGGGYGGNPKMGRLTYDGLQGNLVSLKMTRDEKVEQCYLNNDRVAIKHFKNKQIIKFRCEEQNEQHGKIYWDGDQDAVNGGYSPANDALFGGAVIIDLYQQWYCIPVLTQNNKPMVLNMVVHEPIDNAYWFAGVMTFGDGVKYFYPLTSLGVAAHEISHGFTEQHARFSNKGQTGGMNEAFSDMAAQAADVFAYGKNNWQIGPEIFKNSDRAIRYMDQPSKDCFGTSIPGKSCSIDNLSQYKPGVDVHFSAGIYNRAFYLLATSEGWTVRKAFDVMVTANMHYWTSQSTFVSAACGVLKATKELGYDKEAVKLAFEGVGISTQAC